MKLFLTLGSCYFLLFFKAALFFVLCFVDLKLQFASSSVFANADSPLPHSTSQLAHTFMSKHASLTLSGKSIRLPIASTRRLLSQQQRLNMPHSSSSDSNSASGGHLYRKAVLDKLLEALTSSSVAAVGACILIFQVFKWEDRQVKRSNEKLEENLKSTILEVKHSTEKTEEDLKSSILELKSEMQSNQTEVKAEMQSNQTEVKAALKSYQTEIMAEMQSNQTELKVEMNNLQAAIKAEMSANHASVMKAIDELDSKMQANFQLQANAPLATAQRRWYFLWLF